MSRMLGAALVLWLCLRGTALADVLYTIQELSPLPGSTVTYAHAINDSGQVVGYSLTPGPVPGVWQGTTVTPMLWDGGAAISLATPTFGNGLNAIDINNSGQIVGITSGTIQSPPLESGFIPGSGTGNWFTVAPDSQAPLPAMDTFRKCHQDTFLNGISDTGYMLADFSTAIYSPNITAYLCEIDVLLFYESGLTLTEYGYVYDPFVDFFYDQGNPIAMNSREWVVVPSCTGDLTGYALRANDPFGFSISVPLSLEVSDQVAQSICDLASGELHIKTMNASGQFIVNVDGRAFLYSPVPEPATLALLGIGLAGLAFRRRKTLVAKRA